MRLLCESSEIITRLEEGVCLDMDEPVLCIQTEEMDPTAGKHMKGMDYE